MWYNAVFKIMTEYLYSWRVMSYSMIKTDQTKIKIELSYDNHICVCVACVYGCVYICHNVTEKLL